MSHISPIELVSKEALVKIKSLAFNSETTDLDYKEIFKISDAKSHFECQSQYWLRLNISHRAQTT